MNVHRLLRTSAIRLALRYAVFYALIAGGGLGVLYWSTSHYVDAQVETGLQLGLKSFAALYEKQGQRGFVETLSNQPPIVDADNHRFVLYVDHEGRRLAGDLQQWPAAVKADGVVRNVWVEDAFAHGRGDDHDDYGPAIATRFADGSSLMIVQSVDKADDLHEFLLSTLFTTLALIVGLTLLLGWRMGMQMLARVEQVNATTREILHGNLARRIPVTPAHDEFDELAASVNAMLAHIQQLIEGMRQVTDNVAHDLRKPLSRLHNRLDVSLLETQDVDACRQVLEQSRADIDEVLKTFNALLEIAQVESGHYRGEMQAVDLSALVADIADMYQEQFVAGGQLLVADIVHGQYVQGNRQLLAQLTINLLENALAYAGSGTRVELGLQLAGGRLILSVADNGPGIPVDARTEVLKRFVRLDSARSTDGNGLGLSLVKAVAELHGGALELHDNAPGLRVSVSLPSMPVAVARGSGATG